MMAPAGVELETLVFKPDALTTRPPPCAFHLTLIEVDRQNEVKLSQTLFIKRCALSKETLDLIG